MSEEPKRKKLSLSQMKRDEQIKEIKRRLIEIEKVILKLGIMKENTADEREFVYILLLYKRQMGIIIEKMYGVRLV